jgi:hypothetical protein
MSIKAAVEAMSAQQLVIAKSDCYAFDGKEMRLKFLSDWKQKLSNGAVQGFLNDFSVRLAGPYGDAACDTIDGVWEHLGFDTRTYTIEDFIRFIRKA